MYNASDEVPSLHFRKKLFIRSLICLEEGTITNREPHFNPDMNAFPEQ